jgi:two-component system, sensor histidine kinase RegB
MLDITGGPFNPFILMYGILVWLAAAAVSRTWAAIVGVVALTGSAWLVTDHLQNFGAEHHRLNDFPTHLFTTWMSGVAIAELAVHYVTLANRAIAERQRDADEARARAIRSEHLASLMTLAAGAAHELSTPLGTIAVAARELERASSRQGPASLVDDARLIRTEVDRCQFILSRLSGRAGSGIPDEPALLPPAALAHRAAEGLPLRSASGCRYALRRSCFSRRPARRRRTRSRRCSRTHSMRAIPTRLSCCASSREDPCCASKCTIRAAACPTR